MNGLRGYRHRVAGWAPAHIKDRESVSCEKFVTHTQSAVLVTTHELYPCPHTPGSSQYTALNRYERTN